MDTSWTAAVPSPGVKPPPNRRKLSLSTIFSSLFRRPSTASHIPPPLPDKLLLDGVGILAGILEHDPDELVPHYINRGQVRYTLDWAVGNLHRYHAALTAAITEHSAAATDPDVAAATCRLVTGYVHGAIACAVFLANPASAAEDADAAARAAAEGIMGAEHEATAVTPAQAADTLHACLEGAFILYGIVSSMRLDAFPPPASASSDVDLAGERDKAIKTIHDTVLWTIFGLECSLHPLLQRAREMTTSLASASPAQVDAAQRTVRTIKYLADCVADLPALPRADGGMDPAIPPRMALELRVVAAQLAVTLMNYETRHMATFAETTWIEGTQKYVLECIGAAQALVEDNGGECVLALLDQNDWVPPDDEESGSELSSSVSDGSSNKVIYIDDHDVMEMDIPEGDDSTPSVLASIMELTERFLEADEGVRGQYPNLVLPSDRDGDGEGDKVDIGRHKAARKRTALVKAVYNSVLNVKIQQAADRARERQQADAERQATEQAQADKEDRERKAAALKKVKQIHRNVANASFPSELSPAEKKEMGREVTRYLNTAMMSGKQAAKRALKRPKRKADDADDAVSSALSTPAPEPTPTGAPNPESTPISNAVPPPRPSAKRKSDPEDPEAIKERRLATETEKELRNHAVPQSILDEVLGRAPPAKKKRISDQARAASASGSGRGSRAPSIRRESSTWRESTYLENQAGGSTPHFVNGSAGSSSTNLLRRVSSHRRPSASGSGSGSGSGSFSPPPQ